jgi:hypothetical protein
LSKSPSIRLERLAFLSQLLYYYAYFI